MAAAAVSAGSRALSGWAQSAASAASSRSGWKERQAVGATTIWSAGD